MSDEKQEKIERAAWSILGRTGSLLGVDYVAPSADSAIMRFMTNYGRRGKTWNDYAAAGYRCVPVVVSLAK